MTVPGKALTRHNFALLAI